MKVKHKKPTLFNIGICLLKHLLKYSKSVKSLQILLAARGQISHCRSEVYPCQVFFSCRLIKDLSVSEMQLIHCSCTFIANSFLTPHVFLKEKPSEMAALVLSASQRLLGRYSVCHSFLCLYTNVAQVTGRSLFPVCWLPSSCWH